MNCSFLTEGVFLGKGNKRFVLKGEDMIRSGGVELEPGMYVGWLMKKGYVKSTSKLYDRAMRRVQKEGLTFDSVGAIYENYSPATKERLRRAVQLVDESKKEGSGF